VSSQVVQRKRPGLFARLKTEVSQRLAYALDAVAFAVSVTGASFSALFGKFAIGAVLAGVAIGFVLRLKYRGSQAPTTSSPPTLQARALCALTSLLATAFLVESTNLPVRFNQDGFQYSHWALVLACFLALYWLQVPLATKYFHRANKENAA